MPTLTTTTIEGREIVFHNGEHYELPSDVERYVQCLFLDVMRAKLRLKCRGHMASAVKEGFDVKRLDRKVAQAKHLTIEAPQHLAQPDSLRRRSALRASYLAGYYCVRRNALEDEMKLYAPINFRERLAKFSEHWSPKIIAEMNDYQFKPVKFQGEFVWHDHKNMLERYYVDEQLVVMSRHVSSCCTNNE